MSRKLCFCDFCNTYIIFYIWLPLKHRGQTNLMIMFQSGAIYFRHPRQTLHLLVGIVPVSDFWNLLMARGSGRGTSESVGPVGLWTLATWGHFRGLVSCDAAKNSPNVGIPKINITVYLMSFRIYFAHFRVISIYLYNLRYSTKIH